MKKNRKSVKKQAQAQTNKKPGIRRFVIAAALVVALAAVIVVVFAVNGSAQDIPLNQRKPAIADADLVIQIADITRNVLFYPVDIEEMRMEVLAVRASDGSIRTAFNTCRECFNNGRFHYRQVGNQLICQSCGNRYEMNQIERQAGGCNPEPIFSQNKTVTNSTITISHAYLKEAKLMFESWRLQN